MPKDTPSIPLKWYQRILVNSNRKLVMTSTKDRVISVDWCKGFAIFWITYNHIGWVWLLPEYYWWGRFLFLFLYYLGPVTFLFFAGLNTTMSYRQARAKKIPHGWIYYETFRRMMGLYVLVVLSRLGGYFATPGSPPSLSLFFQWDILQCIVFSVIIVVPLLKFSPLTRVIIAAVIFLASHSFFEFLLQYQTESLLAQIFMVVMYNPYIIVPLPVIGGIGCPFFPMIGYTIIGSIVIDLLLPILNGKKIETTPKAVNISQNNPLKTMGTFNRFKVLLLSSLAIVGISILFGFGPNTDPLFQPVADLFITQLHVNPIFASWEYIPQFLLENHPLNYLFKIGVETCFFLLPFYYFDLKKRDNYAPSWWTRTLSFFGQFSLSYYLYGFFFAAIPIETDPIGFGIGTIITLILLTLLFRFYLDKAYGLGFIEFVMVTFGLIWRIPPSIKDVEAVYPEKVAQYKQSFPEKDLIPQKS